MNIVVDEPDWAIYTTHKKIPIDDVVPLNSMPFHLLFYHTTRNIVK